MSSETTISKRDMAVLAGDAALFNAALYCVLLFLPQIAVFLGPVLAWWLHDRRFDKHVIIGGALGMVLAGFAATALFSAVYGIGWAAERMGAWEFAVPIAALGIAALAFLALVLILDYDGARDLARSRRTHLRVDIARLVSTAIVVVFAGVVTYLQMRTPASEIGEAGIFGLGAAFVGAVTMWTAALWYARAHRIAETTGSAENPAPPTAQTPA